MALNEHLLDHISVGDEIEVFWPDDDTYYPGKVSCRLPSGRHRITYFDGDVEDLVLAHEQWRFIGKAAERVTRALCSDRKDVSTDDALNRDETAG